MQKDVVVCDESELNRTRKIFAALESICKEFDLPVPLWLDKNIKDFKRVSRCRFEADSFIEAIDFDYLEIEVIEEHGVS